MSARLRRFGRELAYLTVGGVTSYVALLTWTVGITVAAGLAVLIVAIPVAVLVAGIFRWAAELDRQNARILTGAPIGREYRSPAEPGIWVRMLTTLRDPQVWRDLAWLVLHSVVGQLLALIALTLVGTTLATLTLPVWGGYIPGEAAQWGPLPLADVRTRWIGTAVSVPLAVITVLVTGPMARAELWLARWLLGPRAERAERGTDPGPLSPPAVPVARYRPEIAIPIHGAIAVVLGVGLTLIWVLTGAGHSFWPVWPWFAIATTVAVHVLLVRASQSDSEAGMLRALLRTGIEFAVAIALMLVVIWALAGGGFFWPVWPMVGMAFPLATLALLVAAPWRDSEALAQRVDVLTRTRRDAVDAQAAELRRIERDLHDGAQARLVALAMKLGRAEARLAADHPEEAALIGEARAEAGAAIAELRDLARGIAPPILVDRGLLAAVQALAARSPVDTEVRGEIASRLPAAIESCAYFVCSEALTNVAKHAAGASATIELRHVDGELSVRIVDDGPGGASESGGGLSGLRSRVAALDGRFDVVSTRLGTTIVMAVPCGS